MTSWSDQDVRVDGTSVMSKKFFINDRGGLDMTPGFRSTNFEVAYLQGTSWKTKQIPEVVRSLGFTIDSCDDDGDYPAGRLNRIAQLNSNMRELFALFARENAEVEIERDVLISDGAGGHSLETWTGRAQAAASFVPQRPEDFDDYITVGIDLLFADPVWYGEEITQTITGTEVLNNPGEIDATNMLLEFSGGSDYRLTNSSTSPEDVWVEIDRSGSIVIDVRAGTAVKDGTTNVIGWLAHDGARQFMRLIPGDNTLTLTGGGSVDVTFSPPRA